MSYFKLSLLILIAAAAVDVAAVTREIQFEELRDGLNNNSLLYVDVRRRDDIAAEGKVVGSFNVPFNEISKAFRNQSDEEFLVTYGFAKPAKDATNVVIGSEIPHRTDIAVGTLGKVGYTSLIVYKGGFRDWLANGGSIIKE